MFARCPLLRCRLRYVIWLKPAQIFFWILNTQPLCLSANTVPDSVVPRPRRGRITPQTRSYHAPDSVVSRPRFGRASAQMRRQVLIPIIDNQLIGFVGWFVRGVLQKKRPEARSLPGVFIFFLNRAAFGRGMGFKQRKWRLHFTLKVQPLVCGLLQRYYASASFVLNASAYMRICLIMASRPLLRVGERCSVRPISRMK